MTFLVMWLCMITAACVFPGKRREQLGGMCCKDAWFLHSAGVRAASGQLLSVGYTSGPICLTKDLPFVRFCDVLMLARALSNGRSGRSWSRLALHDVHTFFRYRTETRFQSGFIWQAEREHLAAHSTLGFVMRFGKTRVKSDQQPVWEFMR